MGLGLLLLTAGAFVRFVLGRYADVLGAYDTPGTVLIVLGLVSMALATVTHAVGRVHVVRARPADEADPPHEIGDRAVAR